MYDIIQYNLAIKQSTYPPTDLAFSVRFQQHKHGKPAHHHHQRSQSLNRGVRGASGAGGSQWSSTRGAIGEFGDMWWQRGAPQCQCPAASMGNKLSCSCGPIMSMRKAYRYEDSPWQTSRRRDGHLLRWA